MRHLTLRELAPAEPCELSDAEALALESLELATLTREASGTWLVAAGTKVGTVRLGDLQVTVSPKLPISRLVFLMGYSVAGAYWRDHDVELASEDDLVEALAHAFRRRAASALDQGLLQGYRTVQASLPVLRGRILVADQISRRSGVLMPLEVTYDDFTVDIAENRILLTACLRLLRVPGVPAEVRTGLHRLRLLLADVTPLTAREPLPFWRPSRLNTRYQPALRLAELILRGDSFEQRAGPLAVSGFVVDMWRVFEDFVTTALAEALARYGGAASVQHRAHLDVRRAVDLRPDFVWMRDGAISLVVDAKYKAEKPAGFPQADLYQLLAYCTVLGLPEGHLIYAAGEQPQSHQIVGASIAIHCHTLDLDVAPAVLLAEIGALAATIMGGTQ